MNQITVTVDLTPHNLEILKQLCAEPVNFKNLMEELKNQPVVPVPADTPVEKEASQDPEPPKFSKMDVKAVCMKLSKEGRQADLRAAFEKFGGKKFSDIKESDYPALMEELGNA